VDELRALQQLASRNTPAHTIGTKLQRSPDAVRSQAIKRGINLSPPPGNGPAAQPPVSAPGGESPAPLDVTGTAR
jgi:hypothetical protein